MTVKNFLKSELKNIGIKLEIKTNGRGGVDFKIEDNQLYVQSINLDTTQRSLKIAKQDLGELRDKLFVVLVLIIDAAPKVVYLIPSKHLSQSDNIFIKTK
ncbi:hypothetical protein [Psychroflexus sp. MES1-P1E]|uniref:hypothetical protein n=1 Tax=Psychroflexus sp. MES1-P1E TaxID=2058320 RepID=UPI000C7B11AC|nr:hypothetical protein [Psychroflexus sp. MES1-P1E]PKG43873.1 hypothetical protein CXF67_02645 [Psychroflexus sp. MES1-P1E]